MANKTIGQLDAASNSSAIGAYFEIESSGLSKKLLLVESSTFTPYVAFGGGTTGITYSSQDGNYTIIGNRLFFDIRIVLTSKGTSTGSTTIKGLPYNTKNDSTYRVSPSVGYMSSVTYTGMIISWMNYNSTQINIMQITEAGSISALTHANFADGSFINVSGNYDIA